MHTRWRLVVLGLAIAGLPSSLAAEGLARVPRSISMPLGSEPTAVAQSPEPLVDGLARTYTTPEAVVAYLHAFTFRTDLDLFGEVDHWQTPEEFVRRRAGDCEDYALLARALLRRNGIEAFVLSLYGKAGYAHTVCVFKDGRGRYNVINQDRIQYCRARSLPALASQLYPAWTFGGIAEQRSTRGRMLQRLTNDAPAPAAHFADPFSPVSF